MLSWLFRRPDPAPADTGLRLEAIPGSLKDDGFFPRPDWDVIDAWLAKERAPECHPTESWALTGDWLHLLREELGERYQTLASRHFRLLCPYKTTKAKLLLEFLEDARRRLVSLLGHLSWIDDGPQVILVFHTSAIYYEYLQFYGQKGEQGGSAGVFIHKGYCHIAAADCAILGLQGVLAHELVHNLVAPLPLPLWLNEGLAILCPTQLGLPGSQLEEIRQEHQAIRECWQRNGLHKFWSGESFRMPDRRQKHSYQLAEILTRILLDRKGRFTEFVANADEEDAGQAAARTYLGKGLGEFAAEFLGPGNWEPVSLPSLPSMLE